ncbi:hypothetical protein SDC9_56330 [bioreactor metagenome]|uniref:Uncharacterized protein n=1 Tax=bioreactor metagenome TaxID=1076179 RepID=A0A644X1L1_9ZZZZ
MQTVSDYYYYYFYNYQRLQHRLSVMAPMGIPRAVRKCRIEIAAHRYGRQQSIRIVFSLFSWRMHTITAIVFIDVVLRHFQSDIHSFIDLGQT